MKGKDFWGPSLWATIHVLASHTTPETEQYFIKFLWLMTYLLPCDYCKNNLAHKLSSVQPEQYKGNMFWYSYIIHDMANIQITQQDPTKPKVSPPYDDVERFYANKDPKFWGPILWSCIHILAVTLRRENAKYYKEMLDLIYC